MPIKVGAVLASALRQKVPRAVAWVAASRWRVAELLAQAVKGLLGKAIVHHHGMDVGAKAPP